MWVEELQIGASEEQSVLSRHWTQDPSPAMLQTGSPGAVQSEFPLHSTQVPCAEQAGEFGKAEQSESLVQPEQVWVASQVGAPAGQSELARH